MPLPRGIAVAVALIAGCRSHGPNPIGQIAVPKPGIAIALYTSSTTDEGYAVIDDRRWIELGASGRIVLDDIDPGAALPSLVLEPLDSAALMIGTCTREAIEREDPKIPPGPRDSIERITEDPATGRTRVVNDVTGDGDPPRLVLVPAVTCAATGRAGRYLLRVLYVSRGLRFQTRHEIVMGDADRATVASRFAIPTPSWHGRADVTLFAGAPGERRPPREVAHGTITLDGTTAILGAPPRDLPAHLRRVYDGAIHATDELPSEPRWGKESHAAIWVWLELDGTLPAGDVFVRAIEGTERRDIDVQAAGRHDTATKTRLPLWIDGTLRGGRKRDLVKVVKDDSKRPLAERFVLSVANLGEVPREVWVEEHLRPLKTARISAAWPKATAAPELVKRLVRTKIVVAPGAMERLGYTLEYAP